MASETCVHHTSENHYKKSVNRMTEIVEYFEKAYKIQVINTVHQE